jgi:hypothetical protein
MSESQIGRNRKQVGIANKSVGGSGSSITSGPQIASMHTEQIMQCVSNMNYCDVLNVCAF